MRNGRPSRRTAISRALARLAVASTSGSDVSLEDEAGLAARIDGAPLERYEARDALFRQRQHAAQAVAAERRLLRRPLHLDEGAGSGHDHVHVDLSARVFEIVEVKRRLTLDD